jgi:lipoprotein-releasing system permease protein
VKLPYQLFISLRYLKSRRKQKFISITTIISIGGIALGVLALIVVLAVMSGFNLDIREKILGTKSHIIVYPTKPDGFENFEDSIKLIKLVKGVKGASPFIAGQSMISFNGKSEGVAIFGIDVNRISEVTNLPKNITTGNISSLSKTKGIIIGSELANRFGLRVKDNITIFVPVFFKTPTGLVPKAAIFTVTGIFKTGMYEYDNSFVYVSLNNSQELFNMKEKITGIEVKVDDVDKAREISRAIRIMDNSFWTIDWMEMNRNLFYALKLEKIAMSIILVLIVLVAGFNILSTLIMLVMEKTKDIGVLKAIGVSSKNIMAIFIIEGTIIGLSGIILGTIGGITTCMLLAKYKFIKLASDVYYITNLPVNMKFFDILTIIIVTLVICIISTIYPAKKASELDPIEAIRYE